MDEARAVDIDSDGDELAARAIVCALCLHGVTSAELAIAVDGRHAHTFANPAGFVFEIRCFASAPGVLAIGAPDSYFSWFEGAAWQVAVCAGCRAHIGWAFTGRATFAALIAERIRDA